MENTQILASISFYFQAYTMDALDFFIHAINLQSIVLLCLVLLLTKWLLDLNKKRNMPPGPINWPLIGCLPQLALHAKNPLSYFKRLGKKHNGLFSLKIGTYQAVFISDYSILKEAFVRQAPCFTDKATDVYPLSALLQHNGSTGIINENGKMWKLRRRFAITALRDMGVGKKTLEERTQQEADSLCTEMAKMSNVPNDPSHVIGMAVTNIICSVIFSERFEYNDVDFLKILNAMGEIASKFRVLDPVTVLKPLQKLPLSQKFTTLQELKNEVMTVVINQIDRHRNEFQPGNIKDLIDLCLDKQEDMWGNGDILSADALSILIYELFAAGSETTATTLRWALLYLVEHPEIQERCHKEIDEVIGTQMPGMIHKTKLPYVDATLAEVQRLANIAPLGTTHSTLYDTTLNGYHIPKGTWVFPMLYAIHLDDNLWETPWEIRPERFLDDNGKCQKPEQWIPFGLGPRVCVGEMLARMELFIFFTAFLQKFKFSKVTPDQIIDFTPVLGITQSPAKQKIQITIR